jgi:glycerol-3-phosphate dehydrogenase (NAD(P)+)
MARRHTTGYNRRMSGRPVAVLGGGTWGLALAAAAARTSETILYSRRAHNGSLPKGVERCADFQEIGRRARLIIVAVPSEIARVVLRQIGDHLDGRHLVVHGVRGLAGEELARVTEVVRQETPARRVGALGGPVLAEDLLAGRPSVMVCGSHFSEVNEAIRAALGHESVRIYTTGDLVGLEWASALVGCLAIGVGYAQALGLSPGLIAAFVSRSVAEAARIAAAAGGEEHTLLGLAGYGDLLACAGQTERPEVVVGRALAQNKPLIEAMRGLKTRVEAVELIPRIVIFAEKHGVSCPIFRSLGDGILASRSTDEIVRALMTAPVEDRE